MAIAADPRPRAPAVVGTVVTDATTPDIEQAVAPGLLPREQSPENFATKRALSGSWIAENEPKRSWIFRKPSKM